MKKYEYKIKILSILITHSELEDTLNKLGSEGWELCVFIENSMYIFKREIIE